ncbi:MAG TPA: PaeR7I family type II restriction endonuclease [Nitrospirota bacterium]
METILKNLDKRITEAVAHYWKTREGQAKKQATTGRSDQGARSAVTGGAQMDGFIRLISSLIVEAGVPEENIFFNKTVELPGYFRPTKEWDLLVVKDRQLIVALEAKSQVGPSFGNNFNNRTEEAMGSALDLWTAYREGAFNKTLRPWLGYLFLLEDCPESQSPVRVKEPHFKVFPEFVEASYAKRYELFCRKIVRERHYNVAAFLLSDRKKGLKGMYQQPAEDLTFELYAKSLIAHVSVFGAMNQK